MANFIKVDTEQLRSCASCLEKLSSSISRYYGVLSMIDTGDEWCGRLRLSGTIKCVNSSISYGNFREYVSACRRALSLLQEACDELAHGVKQSADMFEEEESKLETLIRNIVQSICEKLGMSKQEIEHNLEEGYWDLHPEYEKAVDDFLAKIMAAGIISQTDIDAIKHLIYTAKEPYRTLMLKAFLDGKYTFGQKVNPPAHYTPSEKTVNYTGSDDFAKDILGPYNTFFHENGHAIDYTDDCQLTKLPEEKQYKMYSNAMGREVILRETVDYDIFYNTDNPHSMMSIAKQIQSSGKSGSNGNVETVIAALKSGNPPTGKQDLMLYNAVKKEFQNNHIKGTVEYTAVSDVYGGSTKNEILRYRDKVLWIESEDKYKSSYTHPKDYWQKWEAAGDYCAPGRDLWAEYYSYNMTGDSIAADYVREYFPESAKLMDSYANTVAYS